MAQAEQHLAAFGDMSVFCTNHHQKRTKLQPEKHLIWIFKPDKDKKNKKQKQKQLEALVLFCVYLDLHRRPSVSIVSHGQCVCYLLSLVCLQQTLSNISSQITMNIILNSVSFDDIFVIYTMHKQGQR